MKFLVEGEIKFDVQLEVHADNEESAIALAKNQLNDAYRLDYEGSHHDREEVSIKLDAFKEEEG